MNLYCPIFGKIGLDIVSLKKLQNHLSNIRTYVYLYKFKALTIAAQPNEGIRNPI